MMMNCKRNGNKWTINEILNLQREFELLKMDFRDIAIKHQRSVKAIVYKLFAEGFIDFINYNEDDDEEYQDDEDCDDDDDEDDVDCDDEDEDEDDVDCDDEDEDDEEDDDEYIPSNYKKSPNDSFIIQQLTQRIQKLENTVNNLLKNNLYY
jgi:hypothetical protein